LVDYCGVADVKPILQIDLAETSQDDELVSCVTTGSGVVDGLLLNAGLTDPVPVPVPQLVVDAAKNFAAWAFRRVRDPSSAQGFYTDALAFLQSYVQGSPYVGVA
jgi:hypothetical protein